VSTVRHICSQDQVLATNLGLDSAIAINQYGQADEITASCWQAKQSYNPIGQLTERLVSIK